MSETLRCIQTLVLGGDYLVSDHGFDELEEDAILAIDAVAGVAAATSIEDIRIERVVRASSHCSTMDMARPFMSFGAYRLASVARPC